MVDVLRLAHDHVDLFLLVADAGALEHGRVVDAHEREQLLHEFRDLVFEIARLLIHGLVRGIDVVVGRARGHGVHVEGPEVLVDAVADRLQVRLSCGVRDLLRIRLCVAAVVGIDERDMVDLQAVEEFLQVLVAHAARIRHEPIDLRAVGEVVREAAADQVVAVDGLAHADERGLVELRAPHRHHGQCRVVLAADNLLDAVGRRVTRLLDIGPLLLDDTEALTRRPVRVPTALVACVAVRLVEHGLHRARAVDAPEADTRLERAVVFVPEGHELGQREDEHAVEVPEAEADAVDERIVCERAQVVVEMPAEPLLGRVLPAHLVGIDERHALPERVHGALRVQAVEEIARDLVVARGEVHEPGPGDVEDLLHVGVDRRVLLSVVCIGHARRAVRPARLMPLDRLQHEALAVGVARLHEILVREHARLVVAYLVPSHSSNLLGTSSAPPVNGDSYTMSRGLYTRFVLTKYLSASMPWSSTLTGLSRSALSSHT